MEELKNIYIINYYIHKAVREKSKVVDVDGSYLCHKQRQLIDFGVTVYTANYWLEFSDTRQCSPDCLR